jgi:hypothetical protein
MQDPACNILKSRHQSTCLSGAGGGSRPGSVARDGPAEQAYKPGDEHRSADWPFATVGRFQKLLFPWAFDLQRSDKFMR